MTRITGTSATSRAPAPPAAPAAFTLRRARAADVPELVRVSMGAFRGPTTQEVWTTYYEENPHLPPGRVVVAERDGRIVGSAALLDLRMAVDGRPQPIDGVAAVAVHPAARRQGVADRLLREALADARARGVPYSMLYAFRGSFYRRFGYAPVELGHLIQAAPRHLPDFPERRHVRPYEEADRPAIERCYVRWSAGRTGPLARSPKWWERRVLRAGQDRVVYVAPRSGRVEGYALGLLVEHARLGDRRLRVQELVATTTAARRALTGWLASLGDEFASVEAHLPANESWAPFLRDPNYRLAALVPQQEAVGQLGWGAMARIAHLGRALGSRRTRARRGAIALEIADPVLPGNQEPVTLRFGGSVPEVVPGGRARLRLRAPIDVFAQVWLGAVAASHARAYGLLETTEEGARLLDEACFGPPPFLGSLNEF